MSFLFLIVALILLAAGGIGLFITNTNYILGNLNWILGNLTFGTFTLLGLAIIVFLTLFNSEIE
ncbi:hypothetical protein ACFLWN_04210 [Chloroflexota bacterium]